MIKTKAKRMRKLTPPITAPINPMLEDPESLLLSPDGSSAGEVEEECSIVFETPSVVIEIAAGIVKI